MPRYRVHAVQVVTQDVVFEVETPTPELAQQAVERDPDFWDDTRHVDAQVVGEVELIDSSDEEYHRNIVTKVEVAI